MASTIFLKESRSDSDEIAYVKGQENTLVGLNASLKPKSNISDLLTSATKKILLPQGYPESVSRDYVKYQLWDTLQAFCSTITNTLATKAVLQGVGVGDDTASSLGAAITWIMKDGCGMISRIGFAWISGTRLDGECKKWRLFADVLNDIAICIEIIILPYFKQEALTILCFSTSLKAVVGVAGGATRAAITQHQAIKNNMADVSAKDGSQETCVNLVASFFGLAILSILGDSGICIWVLFFGATFLHLFSNYKAVKALNLNKFNTERLNYVIQDYLLTERICSPIETNRQESVILGSGLNSEHICGYNIKIAESIEKLVKKKQIYPFELQLLTHVYKSRKYLLLTNMKNKVIYLCLDKSYTSSDVLEGYFHAVFHAISASYLAKQKLDILRLSLLENKNSLPYKIITATESVKNEGKTLSRPDADIVIAIDNLASQESSIFLPALSNYVDMEELQGEEREVILSIYDCDPAFKQLSPVTYQYKYGEEGDPRSFLLEIIWGKEYPNEPPKVNMNTFYNKHINESTKKKVSEYVANEALNLVGNAMTYSLFECVKENYLDLIVEETDGKVSPDNQEDNEINEDEDDDDEDDDDENKELESGTSRKKDKKCHLTKAQKRKQWNRVDCHGERPRGWNWVDVIHHLSQTGPKIPENQASS